MFFAVNTLRAQVGFPEIISPAPNAANLASFDLIDGNAYNGTQNYSIPLHQISFRWSSAPLSLNYSGKGVKTSEEASFVGLSWSLNFGGSISRVVQGYDDLLSFGYPNDTVAIPDYIDAKNDIITLDGQNYHFSTSDYWIHYLSQPRADTEPIYFIIILWVIMALFFFKKNDNKRVISTWYLSKILSPNGRELFFDYHLNASGHSDYVSKSSNSYSEKKSFVNAFEVNNGFTQRM